MISWTVLVVGFLFLLYGFAWMLSASLSADYHAGRSEFRKAVCCTSIGVFQIIGAICSLLV